MLTWLMMGSVKMMDLDKSANMNHKPRITYNDIMPSPLLEDGGIERILFGSNGFKGRFDTYILLVDVTLAVTFFTDLLSALKLGLACIKCLDGHLPFREEYVRIPCSD
jgi:hypothetical protein